MQIIEKPIEELVPYEKNPRKNDAAIDPTAASIKEFGFKVPIIIDRNNVIVAGHTRLKAAKKLGMSVVPCIMADDLTEEQVKAYRLADNKTAELAEWDFEMLDGEIAELKDVMDLSQFGFEIDPEPEELEDDTDDVERIAEQVEARVEAGDVWQLGDHRLLCGDSTDSNAVKDFMGGEQADLLITDPPYGVSYSGGARKIKNDNLQGEELLEFLEKAFTVAGEYIKPGGAIYIWHPIMIRIIFEKAIKNAGFHISQILMWVKNSFTLGRSDYKNIYEMCAYGWKKGAAHYFVNRFDQATIEDDFKKIDKMKKEDLAKCLKTLLNSIEADVIRENKPQISASHPTMKPVALFGRYILNSSMRGEIVLDLFGGSGTTIIAAEQCGRKARVIELVPHYCDVIIARWEELTGKKAERIK